MLVLAFDLVILQTEIMNKDKKEKIVNWPLLWSKFATLISNWKWFICVLIIVGLIIFNIDSIKNAHVELNSDMILSYMSLLRWPVIALVAILILRPLLPDVLSRIESLRYKGLEAKLKTDPSQSNVHISDNLRESGEDELSLPTDNQIVEPSLEEKLESDSAKLVYEQIYRKIFGTQIQLLKRLRLYENGLKENRLKEFYNLYLTLSRSIGYEQMPSFMEYVDFLKFNILITHEPTTDVYQLTVAGEYFLRYLQEQQILDSFKSL